MPDSGNLLAVAELVRENYPDDKIIICADDDHKTENNPGLTAAAEAARAVEGLLAVPQFNDDRTDEQTDFNDMLVASGAEAVKAARKRTTRAVKIVQKTLA